MRYEDHIEEIIRKYCEIKGITVSHDRIPQKYQRELQDFIRITMKKERQATARKEISDGLKINISAEFLKEKFNLLESPIEEYMFKAIAAAGVQDFCRPQFEIGKYRVDFAFPIAFLVVECDGRQYHYDDKGLIERDQIRDKYLARKGWRVLHFDGLMIRRNLSDCMDKIITNLKPFILETN